MNNNNPRQSSGFFITQIHTLHQGQHMFLDPPHYKLNIVTRSAKGSILDCYKWDNRTNSYTKNLRIRDHYGKLRVTMEEWRRHYKDQGFQVECTVDWQVQ